MKSKYAIPLILNILAGLFIPYHVLVEGWNSKIIWRFVLTPGPGNSSVAYAVLAAELSAIWMLFFILWKSDSALKS